MSNYCSTCQHYRVTNDGPHCFRGKIKPVSPLAIGDCWEPVTKKPEVVTKTCKKCGRELPVSEFGRHAKTKDGYQPLCRECRSAEAKGRQQETKADDPEDKHYLPFGRRPAHPSYVDEATGETMKWCRLCQQFKPIADFHLNKTSKDGHASECKVCHNARTVEAQRRRIAAKKALKEAAQKEALLKQAVAEMPSESSVLEVTEPVINDLATPIPPIPTLYSATDDQLVQELVNRGYTGNIIKKVSFIL